LAAELSVELSVGLVGVIALTLSPLLRHRFHDGKLQHLGIPSQVGTVCLFQSLHEQPEKINNKMAWNYNTITEPGVKALLCKSTK
jgi:hypothetical protein